ncbi:hypothetical protein BV22DRAFT_1028645 [Leucogyrophana mollusca]|uniref:Uncharacterized protein n=1 Tax=Leucogyrophana mollusca TaxID=85980 RepID=A0ACB8BWT0_9AGAM|nr:hypothetical protein BV22DRAFT_1028645 [Leucogyrophana mollusca]
MDSLQPKPLATNSPEYSDQSALSEAESSDCEWTDIGSNKSDDNDNDSDPEPTSLSRSRRSSVSYGSSRDGDVEGWEGLADDSADEGMPDDVQASLSPAVPLRSDAGAAVPAMENDLQEDQLVNEALDQSMMSTLSSSRSSSLHASTVHSSSRDIRLSFPDPITSSREELSNTSYEDISSPSDLTSSVTDQNTTVDTAQPEDPGPSHTPVVSASAASEVDSTPFASSDFTVSLYGFSSSIKWSFVDKLLDKIAVGAGLTLATSLSDLDGNVRQIVVQGKTERTLSFPGVITVVDRTQANNGNAADPFATSSTARPSLAIVYVPASPPHLPIHTWYLPVLVPSPCAVDSLESDEAIRNSAQQTWDMFNVPSSQVLPLMASRGPSVVDEQLVEQLLPSQAYRAFDRLWTGKKEAVKTAVNSTHALTIFAVVSLVLGVVVGSSFPASTPVVAPITPVASPPTTTPSSIWALLRPVANHPRALPPPRTPSTVAIIPSSLKDFALSVFNPPSTPSTARHHTVATPEISCGSRSPLSWAERFKYSTDLVLRPIPSSLSFDGRSKALSLVPETSHSSRASAEPLPTPPPSSALSTATLGLNLGLRTSVPRVIDAYVPAVLAAVRDDVQDILDALDELVQAITRHAHFIVTQTSALIQQSSAQIENLKGADSLKTVKETFYGRNERAQRRAKGMKDQGMKWIFGAGEMIADHAERAKGKAKEMAVDVGADRWLSEVTRASSLRDKKARKKARQCASLRRARRGIKGGMKGKVPAR